MKKLAMVLILINVIRLSYCQTKLHSVSGTALIVGEYCGGAEPSEETLKLINTPRPIPFLKIFVKKGNTNSQKKKFIKMIHTDSIGQFTLQLKPGTYCMVGEKKSKPFKLPVESKTQKIDSLCYEKEYCKCDLVFTISYADVKDLKITFYEHCAWNQPCIQYSGPVPP